MGENMSPQHFLITICGNTNDERNAMHNCTMSASVTEEIKDTDLDIVSTIEF